MVGVLPNTRNKGIYTDLVATIIYWAQNYGADILEVAIHVCNAPANSLTSQLRSRIWGAHHNFHWHAD
jgi:GNAT superfamily N-acetyltransferase